jgi:hypothetical protein
MMRSKIRCLALAGMALSGLKCIGLEASDVLFFSKGPVSLRPQLQLAESFNDNIFFNNQNKKSDFVSTISPGLNFQVGTEDYNYFKLRYAFDRLLYLSHPLLDANQHRIGTESHFEKRRIAVNGSDEIDFLSSVLAGGISLSGTKVDRTTYLDNYRLDYRLTEKTKIYGEILNSITDYQTEVPLFDSNTLRGTGGFEFQALPFTSFFGEVYYGQTATPPNNLPIKPPHAEFIGGFLGARGTFTEKLTGMVKAGYEDRQFSRPGLGAGLPVVEVSLTERFTENMALSLIYLRRQQVSVQFAAVGYTMDSVSFQWLQNIGNDGRFHLIAKIMFDAMDYQPNPSFQERFDTIITGDLELVYDFKAWLHGTLGYNHERLRSDLPIILDYDVNRVTIGLAVGY